MHNNNDEYFITFCGILSIYRTKKPPAKTVGGVNLCDLYALSFRTKCYGLFCDVLAHEQHVKHIDIVIAVDIG